MYTLFNSTSSSSATICESAVTTPVPSSTFPVKTVTVPSFEIASQESRTVGSMPSTERPSPCASVRAAAPKKLKPTISTPVLFRRSLREMDLVSMFGSPSLGFHAGIGYALDRADDPQMRAAAADIAVQGSFDIGDRWVRIFVEQRLGAHYHAIHAVAALRRLLFDESSLNRVRMRDVSQSFQRGDAFIFRRRNRKHAGPHRVALHEHRARPALPQAAAKSRPVQRQVVAQDVEQRSV